MPEKKLTTRERMPQTVPDWRKLREKMVADRVEQAKQRRRERRAADRSSPQGESK
jgi:hypothetical protein